MPARRKRALEKATTIEGFKLCWRLRSEPQWSSEHGHEGLSIAVQRVDGAYRELVLEYPIATQVKWGLVLPKGFPQRPKISAKAVEAGIRLALTDGWNPDSRGKPYVFQVPEQPH